MAFKLNFGVAFFLSLWSTVGCDFLVEGVLEMECHDRYLAIALDLSATGANPRFEAVDRFGVHAITEAYAAMCGYSITLLPFLGMVELRASYFSCHIEKVDGLEFKFNLITNYDGEEVFYVLNKTCPPPRRMSSREVTCEVNYMEVSMRSDLSCPSEINSDWTALRPTHSTSTSDWQVIFQRLDEQLPPMNLSQARKKGYTFDLMHDRIVFRTSYEKPESYRVEVSDVPVEVVHATLFSRKSWIVLMVDLIAACSMDEGSYDSGYVLWKTPEALYSSYNRTQISVGLNGELVDKESAITLGFIVETQSTIKIGIPYNTEGGYRKSFVDNGIFEFYMFNLYLKQTSVDEHYEETAVRFQRTLVTPLLPCSLFTEDQTNLKEGMFTIYLGDVPEDVELISVKLNGEEFRVPSDVNVFSIVETIHSNKTHSYTLKVPLHNPIIIQKFSKDAGAMLHILDVNYTLAADPEHKFYYHTVSVTTLIDVSPPSFHAVCNKTGISFQLNHQPSDYLWKFDIGPDRLTPALAAKHGYIMSNNSQSLLLFIPQLAHGFKYTDVSLKGFLGTFEILVKSLNTSQVRASTTKTCPFNSTEMILCSTSGWMTVVVDLSLVVKSNWIVKETSLINELCVPKETDGNRVLFSFPLHSCGSKVELSRGNVIYQNKIYYNSGSANATEGVMVQCAYPLAGLHSLFSTHRFESDKEGVGSIIPSKRPTQDTPRSTEATTRPATTVALQKTKSKSPVLYLSSFYPTARYIKVPSAQRVVANFKKGTK
nr:uncharacterized protein LOC107397291 [Nothobranchius furzeri]